VYLLANCHSPVLKIYRHSFLKENNIRFPSNIYGEDVEFWLRCLVHTLKIGYCDSIGYYRRYRKGSIMTGGSTKKSV
jgi:hypothetical protein